MVRRRVAAEAAVERTSCSRVRPGPVARHGSADDAVALSVRSHIGACAVEWPAAARVAVQSVASRATRSRAAATALRHRVAGGADRGNPGASGR